MDGRLSAPLEKDITLSPGDKTSLIYILGFIENSPDDKWEALKVINKKNAHKMIDANMSDDKFNAAFNMLKRILGQSFIWIQA